MRSVKRSQKQRITLLRIQPSVGSVTQASEPQCGIFPTPPAPSREIKERRVRGPDLVFPGQAQMLKSGSRRHPAAGCPLNEPFLQEEWLVDVLEGVALFA